MTSYISKEKEVAKLKIFNLKNIKDYLVDNHINTGLVIGHELNEKGTRQYLYFGTYGRFCKFKETLPIEKRNFHEIWWKDQIKFVMDIEVEIGEDEKMPFGGYVVSAIDDVAKAIISRMCKLPDEFEFSDMIYCDKSRDRKFSIHVAYPDLVMSIQDCLIVATKIKMGLARLYPNSFYAHDSFVDLNIYKTKSLLCIGCKSFGKNNYKYPSHLEYKLTQYAEEEYLITQYCDEVVTHAKVLTKYKPKMAIAKREQLDIGTVDVDTVQKILMGIVEGDKSYVDHYDKWVRIGLSCGSCGIDCLAVFLEFSKLSRKYDESVAIRLYNAAKGSSGLASLYSILKKVNYGKYELIMEDIIPAGKKKESTRDKYMRWVGNPDTYLKMRDWEVKEWDDLTKIVTYEEYNEQWMKPLPLDTDLAIKANKGCGKSTQIYKMVNGMTDGKVIIFVTFRCSLAKEFMRHMKDLKFEYYKDIIKTEKFIGDKHTRIIIQLESLYKLRVKKCDLLILDEYCSIIPQLFSRETMKTNMNKNMAKFQALVKETHVAIVADADLTPSHIEDYRLLRGNKPLHFINNTYHGHANKKTIIYSCEKQIIGSIIKHVKAGKKVVIATTMSALRAQALKEVIELQFEPGQAINKKILLINSKTTVKAPVKKVLENVEDRESGFGAYDIVIYTPSIQAGVSFNIDHFDVFYGLYYSTMPANACRQMTDRVRKFKDKEYHFYFRQMNGIAVPRDRREFDKFISHKQNFDKCSFDIPTFMSFEESLSGQMTIQKSTIYELWATNQVRNAIGQGQFAYRFLCAEYQSGVHSLQLDDEKDEKEDDQIKDHYQLLKLDKFEKIARCRTISKEEYQLIESKIEKEIELTDEESTCREKYNIYSYFGLSHPTPDVAMRQPKVAEDMILTNYQFISNLKREHWSIYSNLKTLAKLVKEQGSLVAAINKIIEGDEDYYKWHKHEESITSHPFLRITVDGFNVDGYEYEPDEYKYIIDQMVNKYNGEPCPMYIAFKKFPAIRHHVLNKILNILGVNNFLVSHLPTPNELSIPDKPITISHDDMVKVVKNKSIINQDMINTISIVWGIPNHRVPKIDKWKESRYVKEFLQFINPKLESFYGISIKKIGKDDKKIKHPYQIQYDKLFLYNDHPEHIKKQHEIRVGLNLKKIAIPIFE